MTDWFSAHKEGLRQIVERLVERRGFGIVAGELYQNAADTNATQCHFRLDPIENKAQATLVCEDDGEGFADLSHAWTMYAPSAKKTDPTKAGRFNIGEKFTLSLCRTASIYTTSGTVTFDESGRKLYPRRKKDNGTVFTAVINCTRQQIQEFADYVKKLIVRPGLIVTFNGERVGLMTHTQHCDVSIPSLATGPVQTTSEFRRPIHVFETTLQTEIGDNLRKTMRKTQVEVYDVLEGETPTLYELGIPVVETEDKYHINVLQKCPLNSDHDNVTPSYLRSVRLAVFNEMFQRLTPEDTTAAWVNEATTDPNCKPEGVEAFLNAKFGKKRVVFDPSNPEANGAAVAAGYTLIPSRGLTPGQRDNAYKGNFVQTSSNEFPTAGKGAYSDHGKPVEVIPEEKYSSGMRNIVAYAQFLGRELLHKEIAVHIVNCKSFVGKPWCACYGNSCLDFNIWKLGRSWFDKNPNEDEAVDRLLLHEICHQFEMNHLSDKYHEAICEMGAKLKKLALNHPELFSVYTKG